MMIGLSLLLLFQLLPVNTLTAATDDNGIGRIQINANSYLELNKVLELDANQNKLVVFEVTITNNGNSNLQMIDYWARLKSRTGASYSFKMTEESEAIAEVVAKSSQRFTFYSQVPKTESLSNLIFQLIKWDFSVENYERKLGEIYIPQNYSYVTPAGSEGIISVNGIPVAGSAKITSMNAGSENTVVKVEFQYTNVGSRGVTFPNFNYYLKSSEGLTYKLTGGESEEDQGDKIIQPLVEEELTLTATLPKDLKDNEQWQLIITKNEKELEIPVGYFALEKSEIIPVFQSKSIVINDNEIAFSVDQATYSSGQLTIHMNYTNKGNQTVTVPVYQYSLETSDGTRYPMQSSDHEVQLEAKASKEQILSMTMNDTSIQLIDALLVMERPKKDNGADYIASFELPSITGVAKTYQYANDNGTYDITLNGLQRLPYGDQDLLAAYITVTNRSTHTVPLLNLRATIELNGIETPNENITILSKDHIINLLAGESADLIVYTKIPYTYTFENLTLSLYEQISEEQLETAAVFKETSNSFVLPVISNKATYTIDNVGQRASLKVNEIYVYEGDYTDLYYTEVELENNEKRPTEIIKLIGYYKTDDDTYYPANVTEVTDKIMPDGKVLLAVWSKLPKGYNPEDLEIIIGEQASEEDAEAYVNAVSLQLPVWNQQLNKINNIQVYPYELTITNFVGKVFENERTISFDYDLKKDHEYAVVQGDHKLVIEIVDQDDKINFTKEIVLETDMTLGENRFEFSIPFKNVYSYFGGFTINIYDQFDGHKRLLASDHLRWNQLYYQHYD